MCRADDLDQEAKKSDISQGLPRSEGIRVVRRVVKALGPLGKYIHCAGSIRREKSLIGDIDLVFCPESIQQAALIPELLGK